MTGPLNEAIMRITGRRPDGVRRAVGGVPQSERRARRRRRPGGVRRPAVALPPAPTITGVRVSRPDQKMLGA
jgi:hypothetical protein